MARFAAPAGAEVLDAAGRYVGVAVTPNLSFIEMTARMLEDLETVLGDPEFERLEAGVRETWRERNPTERPDMEAFAAREMRSPRPPGTPAIFWQST